MEKYQDLVRRMDSIEKRLKDIEKKFKTLKEENEILKLKLSKNKRIIKAKINKKNP